MQDWAIVILAAGKGKRMKSHRQKVLHRLAGRPMVAWVLEAAKAAVKAPVYLILGYDAGRVRGVLGEGVNYIEQKEQLGTGHALLQAHPFLEGKAKHILVLNGDVPLINRKTLAALKARYEREGKVIALLTATRCPPDGLGRVVRVKRRITKVVEERGASPEERKIGETNGGIYCFNASWLWPRLSTLSLRETGEYHLPDLVAMAVEEGREVASYTTRSPVETLGINDRPTLVRAEGVLRQAIRGKWLAAGVTMLDPASVLIDFGVRLGQDTIIFPNTMLAGDTRIGEECELGPNTMIVDSIIGDGCRIRSSVVEGATLEKEVEVGPFCHLRPGSHLASGVRVGNFAEVKQSYLGKDTQMHHFGYVGDAYVGERVNIGAGTVTCNFDGVTKHRTTIGDDAFIGSDSMLVAPVNIGRGAATGAASVVTKDVPPDTLAVGVPARHLPRKKA